MRFALVVIVLCLASGTARAEDPLGSPDPQASSPELRSPSARRWRAEPAAEENWDAHPYLEQRIGLELLGGVGGALTSTALALPFFVAFVAMPCDNTFPRCTAASIAGPLAVSAAIIGLGSALGVASVGNALGGDGSRGSQVLALLGALAAMGAETALVLTRGGFSGANAWPDLGLTLSGLVGSVLGYEVSRRLPGIGSVGARVGPAAITATF